ncbi:MAG: HAMP domain-containing histidine kinase [Clostridiales bacterium]|nr:HAMP domain-containing histidine kinase [Clostridiales bacterium]
MKLWIKISLLAVLVVGLATGISSAILLAGARQSSVELAVQSALLDLGLRERAWQNAMARNLTVKMSSRAQRSLAHYHISQYGDANTILLSGEDVIYNRTSLDPQACLPLSWGMKEHIIVEVPGQTLLITGSYMEIAQTPYALYLIRDISDVYAGIRSLGLRFALVGAAVLAAATGVLILLVRAVLRPVQTLKRNTGLIAGGIYNRPIVIKEKDEIGELAADFNKMAEAVGAHVRELEEEAARRSLFMAALTHELKTPMTAISGHAQTLLRTRMREEEREDALLRIDDACTRIERLSQKMMQLLVLQRGEDIDLRLQSVSDLLEIVRGACAEKLSRHKLTLQIENSMENLCMDTDLLGSLLINLIDNACKASPVGGTITLHAAGNALTVIDHGKGIPPEELSRITQVFYTVDKARSRGAGMGLGLALCETIAKLHGANLEFESEEGKGTVARVVFRTAYCPLPIA